ncbi:MAG: hypothetical protein FWH01_09890 [Oscillospiraceae bacterium]|nr:hypothetical protein [Oscillospiraceae bacterium]
MKPYQIRASHIPQGALDFSYLQDAPAGKHGFLSSREDGHFYFEDGTRIRFWGVNLVSAGGVPDKDAAPIIAERLARNGMNMVRFHHVDSLRGHLSGKDQSIVDYSDNNSKKLNPAGIDKLDYIIYQLKIRGIYTHIDLFTLRMFLPGDGLDYPDLFDDGFDLTIKNLNWFNDRVRELHKIYMEQYLTHYNPYTKTRYVDEPAVAIVQMLNENSIYWSNRHIDRQPISYRIELDAKWNKYLVDKYHTRDNLDEAWTNDKGEKALLPYEDPVLGNVLSPGVGFWREQLSEFDAPYEGQKSPVRIAEHKMFLSAVGDEYIEDTTSFLRGIGVKCVINVSNLTLGPAELQTMAKGDVTQTNTYWNHPQYDREKKYDPMPFHDEYSYKLSPLPFHPGRKQSFKLNLVTANGFAKVAGKPTMVTEWNPVTITRFKPDVMLQMACYCALQDWDGLLLFEYTNFAEKSHLDDDMMQGFFSSNNDPAVWGLMAISSAIVQKGLVSVAKNLIDICYTEVDVFHSPDFWIPYRVAPFVSRTQSRFIKDKYDGDADVVISSGFTSSGDYSQAKRGIIYSRSPYGDFYQKENVGEEFLSKHEKLPNMHVFRDGRKVDRDSQEFYREFRKAMQKFGIVDYQYTMEDDEAMVSDTGELVFDYKCHKSTVNAPQFNAYVGDGGAFEVGCVIYDIENEKMSVNIISRDEKDICESRHLLITAIGECCNTDIEFDDQHHFIDIGHAPILIDPFAGFVTVGNHAENCRAFALNDKGERVENLRVSKVEKGWKIDCHTEAVVMYYEVIFE